MADSLEVNLLSFLSTCAGAEWNLTNAQNASITASVFAGVLLGTIFWGEFSARHGRRLTFLVGCRYRIVIVVVVVSVLVAVVIASINVVIRGNW